MSLTGSFLFNLHLEDGMHISVMRFLFFSSAPASRYLTDLSKLIVTCGLSLYIINVIESRM